MSENPGGVKWAANLGVVPITEITHVAVTTFPKGPATLSVVPRNAVRGGGGNCSPGQLPPMWKRKLATAEW